MRGKCSVMENVLYPWGRSSNVLLTLCKVYCPMAIISLLFLSLSYHLQMGKGSCGAVYGLQDHSHHVAEGT